MQTIKPAQAIIIYGAQASGKTSNAEAFAKHFGACSVRDNWDGTVPASLETIDGQPVVFLTNKEPPFNWTVAQVLTIAEALALVAQTSQGAA